MKKLNLYHLLFIIFFITSCAPKEKAMETSIAQTKGMEEQGALATEPAEIEQAATNTPFGGGIKIHVTLNPTYNYQFCRLGEICFDQDTHNEPLKEYLDVLWLETSYKGEAIELSFKLSNIPDSFTINREGVKINSLEYDWSVSIDSDGDLETGSINGLLNGIDYVFGIFHGKDEEGEISGPFEEVFKVGLFDINGQIDEPIITVDYDENIISTSFKLPGMNEKSVLYMKTYEADSNHPGDWLDDVYVLQVLGIYTN